MGNTSEGTRGFTELPVIATRYNSRISNRYENVGLLLTFMGRNKKLLDIGCGTGSISSILRDTRSLTVVGIEPNAERADLARKEGLQIIVGQYDLTVAEKIGKFDYVLFADVLEHLVDPVDLLKMVKKSLAPNGLVIASIPNVAHWSIRCQLLIGKFDYRPTGIMDATHLRWFTRKSVRRLFEAADYEVEELLGAAGGWMGVYRYTPLRFLSPNQRSFVLGQVCRLFPGLFSVQHIIAARPKSEQVVSRT